ncbi:hypothetical protein MNBD_GAMMA01-1686 [hydrothermal vent metagenome]|uniref:Uncharacterized protein n=1 Tax=hydrothermal vent metagenome TaxID=652676 RepID=A0A3B0URJ4_9ZZZZ
MQTAKSELLVRKQIMLSNENLEKLSLIAKQKKTSVAHIVRNAVDSYEPDEKDVDELQELMELATQKLREAVEDTRATRKHLRKTLNNLSTKEI